MKLQCLIHREGGTEVVMGGTLKNNRPDPEQVRTKVQRVYRFMPGPDGEHVAEVTHEDDIRALLRVRDGYRPYGEEAVQQAKDMFGWLEFEPKPASRENDAAGQPPVTTILLDDDGNELSQDDTLHVYADDEDDEPVVEKAEVLDFVDGSIPTPPKDTADGDEWIAWGKQLPGIEWPVKPKDPPPKDQLIEFAKTNFGADLKKSDGTLLILKRIAQAMRVAA